MRRVLMLLMVITMSFAMVAPAGAATREKSSMQDFATTDFVAGFTTLKRTADGIDVGVHLRGLEGGHAFTVWAAFFNNPDECVDGCDESDLFMGGPPVGTPGGPGGPADPSVVWSGVGGVANPAGNLNANTSIGLGTEGAPGQVLFGPGLGVENRTEIHFIVQDHGPADPDTLEEQTTMFMGGCNPVCVDVQFSVHK